MIVKRCFHSLPYLLKSGLANFNWCFILSVWTKYLQLHFNIIIRYHNGTAHFKNVNNYLNNKIYSSLETSGGQSSNIYLNVVHFFNTSANYTSMAA